MGIRDERAPLAPGIRFPRGAPPSPQPVRSGARHLMRMSGYRPLQPRLYRAWNVMLALTLIIVALPLILMITTALAITQGPRNVFYFGPRIGKDQTPFHIIKFKTLRDEAARLTCDRTLPPDSDMETLLGKPLRDTRLDELPQLFNVLRGDMNMLGPRPVRQSIADQCRRTVPGYDTRFEVKPGLIGYTQALMSHSTDKAIRARVNARLCRRPVSLVQEILFVVVTGLSVLKWTGRVARRAAAALLPKALRPTMPDCGVVQIENPDLSTGDLPVEELRLMRIDATKLSIEASHPLPLAPGPCALPLRLRSVRRERRRCKTAWCIAAHLIEETVPPGVDNKSQTYRYTVHYKTTSPFQKYMIERYFIKSVLVE
jgi:lipopolysaccharide/colanic/teichoic acid biosynthesis glycosyltransferase